jgi:hypothetical protein
VSEPEPTDASKESLNRPDIAGMLFSWAAEKGCGEGACDEISGCDGHAFRACIAAHRPGPEDTLLYHTLRVRLADGSLTLGDVLHGADAASCGARSCDAQRGCSTRAYFRCLAQDRGTGSTDSEPALGDTERPDFPRSGTDLSHGFDEARAQPAPSAPRVAAAWQSDRAQTAPAAPADHPRAAARSLKPAATDGKGVFAPHSLDPSPRAVEERARFEREIRASTDYIFARPAAGPRADRATGRFPSLSGGGAAAAGAAAGGGGGAGHVTPATRAEVADILRLAAAEGRSGLLGRAAARRPRAVVPWERAVRRAVPPPWREDTSRDRAANRALRRADAAAARQHGGRFGVSSAAGGGGAAAAAALRGAAAGGLARFVELADVSGAEGGGEAGWRRMEGPGGRAYWLNSATGRTQWDPPSLGELRAAERRILKVGCCGLCARAGCARVRVRVSAALRFVAADRNRSHSLSSSSPSAFGLCCGSSRLRCLKGAARSAAHYLVAKERRVMSARPRAIGCARARALPGARAGDAVGGGMDGVCLCACVRLCVRGCEHTCTQR